MKRFTAFFSHYKTFCYIVSALAFIFVGVVVSDKFGERSIYNVNTGTIVDHELHDCRIKYKHNSPYLLCIMSSGQDFNVLAKNITDLSSLVYTNI